MTAGGEEPIALFHLYAHNRRPAEAPHGWGSYRLSRRPGLGPRDREVVIDRTCALCGCEGERGAHVTRFASRAGLTPAPGRRPGPGR